MAKSKEESVYWDNLDDILKEAELVRTSEMSWRGKKIKILWMELTDDELPDMQEIKQSDSTSVAEKIAYVWKTVKYVKPQPPTKAHA